MMLRHAILVLFLAHAGIVYCTLSKSDKKNTNEKKSVIKTADKSATERGLVVEETNWKDILREQATHCGPCETQKAFPLTTLAYITPWNNAGYDHAKRFASKLTYAAPVWFQLKRRAGSLIFEGEQNVDKQWVEEVRKGGTRIVPRVLFDGWSGADLHWLLRDEESMLHCARAIADFISNPKFSFDGVVVEIWSQFGGYRKNDLSHLIVHIAEELHAKQKIIVLPIPPPIRQGRQNALFDQYDFATLANDVDFFSLMTYDFANAEQIGPNAPALWIRQCVEMLLPNSSETSLLMRKRLLIGMNFYGYDFVPGGMTPMRGSEYVAMLKEHKPEIKWHPDAAEHFLTYQTGIGSHFVYYPTLFSIELRLQLAVHLQVGGIAIWEIGQGLNYFFDLL